MPSRRGFLAIGLVGGFASTVTSCGSDSSTFVAWPQLDEASVSFLVPIADGARGAIQGPFGAEGPSDAVEIGASNDVYLVTFSSEWLSSRHVRAAPELLEGIRLVDRPDACALCDTVCRDARDDHIFAPVADGAEVRLLESRTFAPTEKNPVLDLWIDIPARWDCVEQVTSEPLTALSTWQKIERPLHGDLEAMGDGVFLLLRYGLRRVGGGPELFSDVVEGENLKSAIPWGDGHALIAVTREYPPGPGRLIEVDFSGDELSIVRSQEFPFTPMKILADDKGVIVVGETGEVATSTDGVSFNIQVAQPGERLVMISHVPGANPQYILGAGNARVYFGDPWDQRAPWIYEDLALINDSSTAQVVEVKGPATEEAPEGRWLWARTLENGSYERPLDGGSWRPASVEVPRSYPQCTQMTDACGFVRMPYETSYALSDGGGVIVPPNACPVVFVAHPDRGCASSVEIRTAAGLDEDHRGSIAPTEGGIVLVLSDQLVFVPTDGL